MDRNEKVRQGPQVSECKRCITWRDLSRLVSLSVTKKTNPCNDQNSNWRLQVEVTRPSEDPAGQLLAEHPIEVQLPAHQILLHTLQRPLVVSQLQSLPFSLRARTELTWATEHYTPSLTHTTDSCMYLESFIGICRHRHGSTTHLLLHNPRLVCTCGDVNTRQTVNI